MKYEGVQIDAFGYELAPDIVTSEELEERLDPLYRALKIRPGQIEALTGIVERRFWPAGYSVVDGAVTAAQRALDRADVPSGEIGALVYGGVCRENFEPATACHVAGELERLGRPLSPRASVHDVANACLGVVDGMLEIANRIELGQIRAGMVVSCESAREIVELTIAQMLADRDMEAFRTRVATMTGGSGAVAVVLSDGSFGPARRRLLGGVVRAAPRHHMLCRWGMRRAVDGAPGEGPTHREFMETDSVKVLEHGVELGKKTFRDFLAELGWARGDIDRTISHQVGAGHRESILRALEIESDKDYVAYDYLGNTGTVALPLAAALAEERGFLEPGHKVGFLGIGSGLNCMMVGVQW